MDGYSLPKGPVFLSPRTLAVAAVASISDPSPMKKVLIKSIIDIFDEKADIFHGAYGNKDSDARAYRENGIPPHLIYLVDESSVMKRLSDGKITSYAEHEQQVNFLYPRI